MFTNDPLQLAMGVHVLRSSNPARRADRFCGRPRNAEPARARSTHTDEMLRPA